MSLSDKIMWKKNEFGEPTLFLENVKESIQRLKQKMSDEIIRINKPLGILQIERIIEEEFGKGLTSSKPKTNNSQQEVQPQSNKSFSPDESCEEDSFRQPADTLRGLKIPKGFKKATCKCGNKYAYVGEDIGYCVECLDKVNNHPIN